MFDIRNTQPGVTIRINMRIKLKLNITYKDCIYHKKDKLQIKYIEAEFNNISLSQNSFNLTS